MTTPQHSTQNFRWEPNAGSTHQAEVIGFAAPAKGVDGEALCLDGFSASVEIPLPPDFPREAFTITAGIALAAYPWNICPVLDALSLEEDGGEAGFQCAIDDRGTPRFMVVTERGLHTVVGDRALDLRQWRRLAFSYVPGSRLTILLDGAEIGRTSVAGAYRPPTVERLIIGRTRREAIATGPIRPNAHMPFTIYLDGLIESIAVEAGTPPPSAFRPQPADIAPRVLPAGPKGPGRFGATYEHLRYYQAWDRRWRVGDHPDVLVRFDKSDSRVVFWRGANYIPCWVSGDGVWYTNEFNETWGHGATGCAEPMSDKHCAYSHVRIIEAHDARVVVHWRYALVDVLGVRPRRDPVSGWTDFSDEVYTIYPDGAATRSITLHSTQPMESHEFQESIVVLGPGQRPEDVLEIEPVTLANMLGETHTYSWAAGRPRRLPAPARANIVVINTKSAQKPYFIVQPGPCLTRDDGPQPAPLFPPYYHETLEDGMKFPWWNHWPTSDIPSDGRRAVAADRASHSSVLTGSEWADYKVTPTSRQRVMLHGLTTARAEELVPLAKSWLNPPALSIAGTAGRYDQVERAYVVNPGASVSALSLRLEGSTESPVLNPAFIFAGWSPRAVRITLDGAPAAESDAVRIGRRHHAAASDLIVWIELDRLEPVTIEVAAA